MFLLLQKNCYLIGKLSLTLISFNFFSIVSSSKFFSTKFITSLILSSDVSIPPESFLVKSFEYRSRQVYTIFQNISCKFIVTRFLYFFVINIFNINLMHNIHHLYNTTLAVPKMELISFDYNIYLKN